MLFRAKTGETQEEEEETRLSLWRVSKLSGFCLMMGRWWRRAAAGRRDQSEGGGGKQEHTVKLVPDSELASFAES